MTAERIARLREHVPTKNPGAFAAGFTRSDMLFLLDLAEEALVMREFVAFARERSSRDYAADIHERAITLSPRGENEETK